MMARLALLLLASLAVSTHGLVQPRAHVTLRSPASRLQSRVVMNVEKSKWEGLPNFLRPDTNGGVIGLSVLGTLTPFVVYNGMIAAGVDVVRAGQIVLVAFVGLGTIAWTGSYVFRVATKDTTYAQQLKDYETAVLEKRLEELDESEIEALMDQVDDEKL